MFDWIPIIGDWHWTLTAIWIPALLLPLFLILLPLAAGWHTRRFERQNRREWAAGRNGSCEMPEHPAETGLILTFLYLVTVAPLLTLASLFLTGVWDWPLARLPLTAEIYLVAILLTFFIGVLFLFYDNEEGVLPFFATLMIGTPLLIATLLISGELILPFWVYIVFAVVFLPPFSLAMLTRVWKIFSLESWLRSSLPDNISALISFYLIVMIPLGALVSIYILAGILITLLVVPAFLFMLFIISSLGEGGDGSFLDLPFSITRS